MSGFRPRRTFWQQLDYGVRMTCPAWVTFLLLLLANLPVGQPVGGNMGSAVLGPCVIFWVVFRPQAMPAPVVLFLGVLADLLSSTSLGVHGLALLIVWVLVIRWRKTIAQQSFVLVWFNVVLLSALYALVFWALLSLLALHIWPVMALVPQVMITLILYPLLSWLLTRVHHLVGDAA